MQNMYTLPAQYSISCG